MDVPHFLADDDALQEFLASFEQCRLPGSDWTHAAHVAMASVYLRRYGDGVLAPTRESIKRFNASVGGPPTAYHETLTVLWLALVADAAAEEDATDVHAARRAVALFSTDSKRHGRCYSFDVLKSEEARAAWVPPDLIGLRVHFTLPQYG